MFERRRCHFTHIFELFAQYIYLLVVIIFSVCISIGGQLASDEEFISDVNNLVGGFMSTGSIVLIITVLVVLALAGILLLYCTFKWRHTYVSAKDNTLIYESGKFIKKRVAIPFEKINTIDMGRNIFERIVGTCRLKVDTGAYSSREEKREPEMNLVFKLAEADEIRAYILNRAEADAVAETAETGKEVIARKEPDWAIRAGMTDFMLYGLTSSSVWRLFWLVILGVCFIAELSTSFVEYVVDMIMPFAEAAMETVAKYDIIAIIIFALIISFGIALISNIGTIVWAAVRFYGFRVAREGRNVIVRYGLFTEKNYTLQVRNIHAVIVKQNMFQQLLGRCSVEAVCMGFGDEQNETALLFPIIKKSKLNDLLGVILPEYVTEMHARPKKKIGFVFHAITPAIFWGVIGAIACVVCSLIMDSALFVAVIAGFIVLMRFISGVLSYRNTTLDWNDKVVSVQSGGFTKRTYRIRTDAVQEVQIKTNLIKRMFGIGTYFVHYHGPTLNNTSSAGDISNEFFAELADTVED